MNNFYICDKHGGFWRINKDIQWKFNRIYDTGMWARSGENVPLSGTGSSLDVTDILRKNIKKIVQDYEIKTIFDGACGDMTWMSELLKEMKGVVYTGGDISNVILEKNKKKFPHIKFINFDLTSFDGAPTVDLMIIRDVLQHLTIADINKCLEHLKSPQCPAKYVLMTTYLYEDDRDNMLDIMTGGAKHRNLLKPPFNVSDPIFIFSEGHPEEYHKFMGLWKTPIHTVAPMHQ